MHCHVLGGILLPAIVGAVDPGRPAAGRPERRRLLRRGRRSGRRRCSSATCRSRSTSSTTSFSESEPRWRSSPAAASPAAWRCRSGSSSSALRVLAWPLVGLITEAPRRGARRRPSRRHRGARLAGRRRRPVGATGRALVRPEADLDDRRAWRSPRAASPPSCRACRTTTTTPSPTRSCSSPSGWGRRPRADWRRAPGGAPRARSGPRRRRRRGGRRRRDRRLQPGPPAAGSLPDGGWPAATRRRHASSATRRTGPDSSSLHSLPEFKSPTRCGFPLVRRGAVASRTSSAARLGTDAAARRVLCDALFEEVDRRRLRRAGRGRARRGDGQAPHRPVPGGAGPVDLGVSTGSEHGLNMRTPAPQTPAFAVPETRTWRASGSCPGCSRRSSGGPRRTPGSAPIGRTIGRRPDRAGIAGPTPADDAARSAAGCDRAVERSVGWRVVGGGRRLGRLERAAEAAHPDGEVVLHDLADLRLGEHLVGAERVLDPGGRVDRAGSDEAEVLRQCRRPRAARAGRGRASSPCRATACDRRGSAGRSSSDRRPTAARAGAATSSWP